MTSNRPVPHLVPTSSIVFRLMAVVLVVDCLLVLVNFGEAPSFLNLDEERNFTTWYSSAKLLLAGLGALACWRLEPATLRAGLRSWVWPVMAAVLVALSVDETATAHERLAAALMSGTTGESLRARLLGGDSAKDAYLWPVLFAPLAVALIWFLVSTLWARLRSSPRARAIGLVGCAAFVTALLLEGPAVWFSPPVEAWGATETSRYVWFALIEESAELIGTTAMLAATVLHAAALAHAAPPTVED